MPQIRGREETDADRFLGHGLPSLARQRVPVQPRLLCGHASRQLASPHLQVTSLARATLEAWGASFSRTAGPSEREHMHRAPARLGPRTRALVLVQLVENGVQPGLAGVQLLLQRKHGSE